MLRLFSWTEKTNFGDALSKDVVEFVSGEEVQIVNGQTDGKLLAVGSILQRARSGDVLWGTGVHPYGFEDFWKNHSKTSLDLTALAVRGPMTRDVLLSRGIDCPGIYGDPGILLPLLYPKARDAQSHIVLIPHLSEMSSFKNADAGPDVKIVLPTLDWRAVVDEIIQARYVVSSSLHGLIVAEAYGVPAVWYRPSYYEGYLKYADYYLGTGRPSVPVYDLNEALHADPALPPNFEPQRARLIEAFDLGVVRKKCSDGGPYSLRHANFRPSFTRIDDDGNDIASTIPERLPTIGDKGPDLRSVAIVPAGTTAMLASQPSSYAEHYPFVKGEYSYPSTYFSILPGGYHTFAESCRHNVATRAGAFLFESFSHDQQSDLSLQTRALEKLGQIAPGAKFHDLLGFSVINQSGDNYFHWLLQTLPSVLISDRSFAKEKKKFILGRLNSWQLDSLAVLGIKRDSIFFASDACAQFACLVRPSPVNYMTRNAMLAPVCKSVFDAILTARFGGRRKPRPGKAVYVSRQDASQRRVINEEAFIERLVQLGFQIVVPSKLSFIEQVEVFSDADLVLGTHGAGLTNFGFAPKEAKVFEIFPAHYMDGSYFALATLVGQDYKSWTSKFEFDRNTLGSHAPWSLDIEGFTTWFSPFVTALVDRAAG